MKTNESLQQDVLAELHWEPILHGTDIEVSTNAGVVTLSGQVSSYPIKLAAERAAKRVKGVEAVSGHIRVITGDGIERSDEQIDQAIVHSLTLHAQIPQDQIQASVQAGQVTLEGTVDWNYQRQLAQSTVESLTGVKGVTNLIQTAIHPIRTDIETHILTALSRNAALEAQQIQVTVAGDQVTLTGPVRSFAERDEAENAVWGAVGVRSVKNNLLVSALNSHQLDESTSSNKKL